MNNSSQKHYVGIDVSNYAFFCIDIDVGWARRSSTQQKHHSNNKSQCTITICYNNIWRPLRAQISAFVLVLPEVQQVIDEG